MPVPPLTTAQHDWERRAGEFRSRGIPDSAWTNLYQYDMQRVYGGSQPLTDAEVFSGVVSAVKGPQIQDPQPQHGHGGFFSGLLDTIGNIPHDIGGIITGFPAGIYNIARHLPSELSNTGELIAHLAEGDNKWLHQKGYLAAGDNLHESWGDFAKILRAMDTHGNKQLLPYMPFIADLANMTSAQGRTLLQQHPVGAFLDVLPGIAKGGKVATAGMKLDGTARFYAAGRALQAGNPVKAVVSAVGDVIPAGQDEFMRNMTLRERVNLTAKTMGIDRYTREGVLRPFQEATTALEYRINAWMKQKFGNDFWRSLSVSRAHYLYLGTHLINPESGEVFRSREEYNTWRSTQLTPEENAGIDAAQEISEAQRQAALLKQQVAEVPFAHGLETVSTKSVAYRSWKASIYYSQLMDSALNRFDQATSEAARQKAAGAYVKAKEAHGRSLDKFAKAQITEFPEEWNPGLVAAVRQGAIAKASNMWTGKQLDDAVKAIKNSVWDSDFIRLLGEKEYNLLVSDAIKWWKSMTESGAIPIWTHRTDPAVMQHILEPSLGSIEKPRAPSAYSQKELGLYFGDTVYDLAVSITANQMEVFRQEAAVQYIRDFILPRSYSKLAKKNELVAGMMQAVKDHPNAKIPTAQRIMDDNFVDFNPEDFGLRRTQFKAQLGNEMILDKDLAKTITNMMDQTRFRQVGGKWIMRGTSLYKFSVLTGPRHLAHVAFGGATMMMLREPLAPLMLLRAVRIMNGTAKAEDHGLAHGLLSGLKQKVYQIGPHHTWQEHGIGPYYAWHHAAGGVIGDGVTSDWIHQAKQAGIKVAEFVPNRLARLEENIIAMYKVATYLSAKEVRGLDREAALETAHKVFVDVNGMSLMERTAVKQIFPFYAFTRHLFRYLATYPVDYPLRAAMVAQFAEGEQADWKSGLPRSYMSLLWLGTPDSHGNVGAIDLKNANPFRSFANDFSFAGFFSSLSPFLTGPLAAVGVDTLSGTTQLYPGLAYNPQTGSLQATPPPGGLISLAESFVPQVGLLDHFYQLTNSTRLLAKFSPLSYKKQIYNMLNVPFVPEVYNVPYQQEVTEIRRFRAAQAAVALVKKNPSAANIAKLMEWNVVPFNNELIPPSILAAYYEQVKAALSAKGEGFLAPQSVLISPPKRPAQIQNY